MRPTPSPSRHSRRARSCPTGKRRFPDAAAAKSALHSAQGYAREGNLERRERRVYECDACNGAHLTSQEG